MSTLFLTLSACLLYTSSNYYRGTWSSRLSDVHIGKKTLQILGFVCLLLGIVLESFHYDVVTAIINTLFVWTLFVSLYVLLVPLIKRGQLVLFVTTILIAFIRQYLFYAS